MTHTVSDADLAEALNIPIELLAKLTPAKRAVYEKLINTADRLNRGERPPNVIVCGERRDVQPQTMPVASP